jgi:hypothetical protein
MRSMVVAEGYQHNKIFVSFDEIVRHERSEYARDLRTPCRATFIRDLPFQDGVKRLGLGFESTRLARKKLRDLNRVGHFQGAILRCALDNVFKGRIIMSGVLQLVEKRRDGSLIELAHSGSFGCQCLCKLRHPWAHHLDKLELLSFIHRREEIYKLFLGAR